MSEENKTMIISVMKSAVKNFRFAMEDVAEVYADNTISAHEKDERAALIYDRLNDRMRALGGKLYAVRFMCGAKLIDNLMQAVFDMGADFVYRQRSIAEQKKNEKTLKTMQHYFYKISSSL